MSFQRKIWNSRALWSAINTCSEPVFIKNIYTVLPAKPSSVHLNVQPFMGCHQVVMTTCPVPRNQPHRNLECIVKSSTASSLAPSWTCPCSRDAVSLGRGKEIAWAARQWHWTGVMWTWLRGFSLRLRHMDICLPREPGMKPITEGGGGSTSLISCVCVCVLTHRRENWRKDQGGCLLLCPPDTPTPTLPGTRSQLDLLSWMVTITNNTPPLCEC